VTVPSGQAVAAPQNPATGVEGFFMSGEARPLGFVAVTKKGTRFISVGKMAAKQGDDHENHETICFANGVTPSLRGWSQGPRLLWSDH